ncbi:hypothetical protein SKAU_G00365050 [Synaphobranchus kaupii]|uniref:Uncharacterized protein n=1 Tax=Synaphobranchus kaupii TaxID=118154 RepID=A0A9Q1EEX4_SYNKA|nr:hypothetical protein SKAU_G00365050 [Synaphobranchus kaupii]
MASGGGAIRTAVLGAASPCLRDVPVPHREERGPRPPNVNSPIPRVPGTRPEQQTRRYSAIGYWAENRPGGESACTEPVLGVILPAERSDGTRLQTGLPPSNKLPSRLLGSGSHGNGPGKQNGDGHTSDVHGRPRGAHRIQADAPDKRV